MGDLILIKIMKHLDYLDCLEISTRKILKLSLSEGIDGLECLTENRERLINIIKSHQMTISSDIKEIMRNRDVVDNELKDIFKAWGSDTHLIIERIKLLEENVSHALENKRVELQKGLIHLHKEKKLVEKYSLSTVK
ncbi:MAG: hypothetical protein OEY33_09290 [Bdellovibrionales bacterium]|nr:hypothetical protein [Bdellovibrionales bacterium]